MTENVRLTHLAVFSPFFFSFFFSAPTSKEPLEPSLTSRSPSSLQQRAAAAAAGLQRTTREEREEEEEGRKGGEKERQCLNRCKEKKNMNHKNKNTSLPSCDYCTWEQAVGVEVDDRQEETRWTLQSCGDNFALALWIRRHQAKASYMCRKIFCYLASDNRPAKCLSAGKDGLQVSSHRPPAGFVLKVHHCTWEQSVEVEVDDWQ